MLYSVSTRIANMFGKDKLLHYIVSKLIFIGFFIVLTAFSVPYALFISVIAAWSIGTIKELLDYTTQKGQAELADIAANTLGILSAAAPLFLVLYVF